MCNHGDKSLVEMTVPSIGSVITIQCDVCGAMLPREPIADEIIDAWNAGEFQIPHIDTAAWKRAVTYMIRAAFVDEEVSDLATFAKVARQ